MRYVVGDRLVKDGRIFLIFVINKCFLKCICVEPIICTFVVHALSENEDYVLGRGIIYEVLVVWS